MSATRDVLDLIADYVEARSASRASGASEQESEQKLNEIARQFFAASQRLNAVHDDPNR